MDTLSQSSVGPRFYIHFFLMLFFPWHFHQTPPPQSRLPASRLGYFLWNLLCRICFRHQLPQSAAVASQLNGASPIQINQLTMQPLSTHCEILPRGTQLLGWGSFSSVHRRAKNPLILHWRRIRYSSMGRLQRANEHIPYADLENIQKTPKVVSGMYRGWVFKMATSG